MTCIQSFDEKFTKPQKIWDEKLRKQIGLLNTAIITGDPMQILSFIQENQTKLDKNINGANIHSFLQKAAEIKETTQLINKEQQTASPTEDSENLKSYEQDDWL